ncbi:hypothetical protein BDU57DRAFT_119788 [Ampelomyces quisqualis]|uniref:Small nuclear ribonucleoprotein Prp3 C-terminal domain-containing protein n=1 Tax=Ampelomyces quisqualis TaxID=50730 RepID=A0A6A5QVB2_AMPQU|nr:hypothetical protein BDU57DRAFT_119788 [Ampelomyces quisqualis]
MATQAVWHILPTDLIELQLGQIDLLLAMYPEETTIDEGSQNTMDVLRDVDDASLNGTFATAPSVLIVLQVTITEEPIKQMLDLDFIFPFSYENSMPPEDPPDFKVRIRQPYWLNRAATNQLMADLPTEEDLLGTIEHIKEAAAEQLEQATNTTAALITANSGTLDLVRVWFYFPSISTRSKRDDFIIHAPSYRLTGFLYAGKPGLLCVEGDSQSIDDYMKFIKTESWGDIPAHHKKVSERYRETKDVKRVFPDMTEITDMVGERRGQRANRGDMKAMEEWLTERTLGNAFAKVLM